MQHRPYPVSLHDTGEGNGRMTFMPSNHDRLGFIDWQAHLTVIRLCLIPCFVWPTGLQVSARNL